MKSSRVLAMIGGGLGLLAFFLPWFSFFIISVSLYDLVNLANNLGQGQALFSGQGALIWLEPIVSAALLLFALLAGSMGKSAHVLNLIAALVGLGGLVYIFAEIQSALSNSSVATGVSATSLLGIGFWAAGIAFLLGLIGAIMGMREQPVYTSTSSQALYVPAQSGTLPPLQNESDPIQPPPGQSGPYQ